MTLPLMPKATAVWLVENTALSFRQIAQFCGLHTLEVQAIADGEIIVGMTGFDPIVNGQLTPQEIERCAADPKANLTLLKPHEVPVQKKRKGRYVSVALRQDRPDAILWLIKNYPKLSDYAICSLLGTTKAMIQSIRMRSHKNILNMKPRHPVTLGFCTQEELNKAVAHLHPDSAEA